MAWPLACQRWRAVTFLHWAYDPADVRRLLPPGLKVHTYDGVAWVGITPFHVRDFRPPGLPAVPWLSTFPETNVRTYVVNESGLDGLWFLSLDASGLATVLGARAAYRVPYHWAAMTVEVGSRVVTYRSRRRWPPAAAHDIVAEPGPPLPADELGDHDHFLTGRWRAFTRIAGSLAYAPVEHQAWPLCSVRIHQLDEDLLVAAGLPAPEGEPVVHYSTGVDVRLGAPRW